MDSKNLEKHLNQLNVINNDIKALEKYRNQLNDKFIAKNRLYADGEKVNVKEMRRLDIELGNGVIKKAFLDNNEIRYSVLKMKRDGNPSKIYLDYSGDNYSHISENRISKIEGE